MSIYYDWRFEDFSHLQMLLAFPYLIFKSRSAIRKVGQYTREYVVVWSFIYIYIPHMADRDLNISLIVDTQLLPHAISQRFDA
jgi:uncharacterized protein YceK